MSHFPKITLFEPPEASVSKHFLFRCLLQLLLLRGCLCVSFFVGLLSFPRVWLALSPLCPTLSLFLCPHGPGQVPPSPRCLVAVDCPGW